MSNLKTYITAKYGAETYKTTLALKEAKKKQARSKNQLIFLERCVSHHIIPKFLGIKDPIRNRRSKGMFTRFRYEMLVCLKNETKHRHFNVVKKVKDLQLELSTKLSNEDTDIINDITEKAREAMFFKSKERIKKKFDILQTCTTPGKDICRNQKHVKEAVLNLCDNEMKEDHRDLLNLGPKFVPNVKQIPYLDIISTTESSSLKLEYNGNTENAQTLRRDVLRLLKTCKPPPDNLSRNQRKTLKEIKEDKNISIYPLDKGSGFVRIENEKAITKIREQIGSTKIVKEDPTQTFAHNIRNALCKLKKKGRFTKNEYERLYPSDPNPPRMYGTIKAHKPEKDYPMRIVVSTIGTPTHGISKYLVKLIQPTLNKNEIMLKNSSTFVEEAKTWEIAPQEVQVSYDVVNLYPAVPLKEATDVIVQMISNDTEITRKSKLKIDEIKMLIELCLSKCYFLWNNEIHILENSGPIGLSLMVVIAESFLQYVEKKAINMALSISPAIFIKSFKRYVDDSHARFNNFEEADRFKDILNQQHENIKYTIEREDKEKVLNFLDVRIKNDLSGKYEFGIHRKEAITNVQIKKNSSHDPKIQYGVIKGFVHRAFTICSKTHIEQELKFLTEVFIENGYEESEITNIIAKVRTKHQSNNNTVIQPSNTNDLEVPLPDTNNCQTITLPWIPGLSPKLRKIYKKAGYKTVFKSNQNLKTILSSKNKSSLPKNSNPGVYKIGCTCKRPYTGESKMKICTRGDQHLKNTLDGNTDKSAIALHSSSCTGQIEWDKIKTIKIEPNKFDRKVREALEIQYQECGPQKGGMNLDDGQYVTTKFWTPMFKYLRNQRNQRIENSADTITSNQVTVDSEVNVI